MATTDELRAAVDAGCETLSGAIAAAGAIWEEAVLPPEGPEVNPNATGDAWTPRQTVEHAVAALGFHAALIGLALGGEPPERGERPEFGGPDEAVAALGEKLTAAKDVLGRAEDGDLEKPARMGDPQMGYLKSLGIETTASVEGAFRIMAAHLEDHAAQIGGAL